MNLPEIISVETDAAQAVLALEIPAELEVFEGHFPNNPILPGVVQLDWAMRFAQQHLKVAQNMNKNFKVKFHHKILPGMPLVLKLAVKNDKLDFSYHVGDQQMSAGQFRS